MNTILYVFAGIGILSLTGVLILVFMSMGE